MIEDEIISIKLAIQLKELGLRKPSLYSWIHRRCGVKWFAAITSSFNLELHPERLNAYTCNELGRMLPSTFKTSKFKGNAFCRPKTFYLESDPGYHAESKEYSPTISYNFYTYDADDKYEADPTQLIVGIDFTDTNEANLRARMLIWLIENGHVKVDNNSDKVDKV